MNENISSLDHELHHNDNFDNITQNVGMVDSLQNLDSSHNSHQNINSKNSISSVSARNPKTEQEPVQRRFSVHKRLGSFPVEVLMIGKRLKSSPLRLTKVFSQTIISKIPNC